MSSYSKSQTQNSGSLGEAIEGEKLFTITNSKNPTDTYSVGYFTLDGNSTSNQNLSSNAPMGGIFSDFTGGVNPNSLIQTNTRFSISIYGSGGSFKFTPSTPIPSNSYYVKSVGEFDIEMAASSQPIVEEFIFKIDTTLGNGSNEFHLNPEFRNVIDFDIDWGDNITQTITSNNAITHSYLTSGIYTIKLNLTRNVSITQYRFWLSNDKQKIIEVVNWGTVFPSEWYRAFYGCSNLTKVSDQTLQIISSGRAAFAYTGILTGFDTLKINGDGRDFLNGSPWNGSLQNWDLTNTTNIESFFSNTNFTGYGLSNTTCTPIFCRGVFYNTPLITCEIGHWDMTNCVEFLDMFRYSTLNDNDYRNILIGWTGWNGTNATKTLNSNQSCNFQNARYEIGGQSEDVRNYLINTLGWTITDGGGI